MTKISYPWIDIESLYSAQSIPRFTPQQTHRTGFNLIEHHTLNPNLRKADAVLQLESAETFQRIKTLIYRGEIHEAKSELQKVSGMTDADEAEILCEKARLSVLESRWEDCVEFCHLALTKNPHSITRMTILQLRALGYCELEQFQQSLRDLQSIDSLAQLYPHSPVLIYVQSLKVRVQSRLHNHDKAKLELKNFWDLVFSNLPLNLDSFHSLLRAEIDAQLRSSTEGSTETLRTIDYALASLRVTSQLGDRLYCGLGRIDLLKCHFASEMLLQDLQDDVRLFTRVEKEFSTLTHKTDPNSFAKTEMNEVYKNLNSVRFILVQHRALLIDLQKLQTYDLSKSALSLQFMRTVAGQPASRESLISTVWGIKKYAPHLHENIIDKMVSRLKQKFALPISIRNSKVILNDVLVLQ